jgi:hypothetical protein
MNHFRINRVLGCLFAAGLALGNLVPCKALTIQFDYSHDDSGFFGGANVSRRTLLDSAASVLTSRITDSLTAITPGGGNSWAAQPFDPSNPGSTLSISNLVVPANTVVVFVGSSASLGSGTLGEGGPGGYGASGSQ